MAKEEEGGKQKLTNPRNEIQAKVIVLEMKMKF